MQAPLSEAIRGGGPGDAIWSSQSPTPARSTALTTPAAPDAEWILFSNLAAENDKVPAEVYPLR